MDTIIHLVNIEYGPGDTAHILVQTPRTEQAARAVEHAVNIWQNTSIPNTIEEVIEHKLKQACIPFEILDYECHDAIG